MSQRDSDSATHTHRWGLQSRWWGAELTVTLANRRPLPCHPGTGSGPPHPYRCPEPAGQDTEGAGSDRDKHSEQHLTPNKINRDQKIQMPPGPHTDEYATGGTRRTELPETHPGLYRPLIPPLQMPGEGKRRGPPLTDLSLVTLEAKLSAIRLFSRSRISSTAPGL